MTEEERERQRQKQKQKQRDLGDEEERRHFLDCVCAFQEYEVDMLGEVARRERHLSLIPRPQLSRLPAESQKLKIKKLKLCIKVNQNFCDRIVEQHADGSPPPRPNQMHTMPHNASKVRSCFHQCAREWSEEGRSERDACFAPIIRQMKEHLAPGGHVLCPGAGLGRLPVEIVHAGYSCQGNEFSYHMLLVSDYILNKVMEAKSIAIHPWVDNTCNVRATVNVTRLVKIPDQTAGDLISTNPGPNLSMCAGEFIEVYSQEPQKWDCVVTCFFLDTAPNVFEYIQTIFEILKPGALWINHGPLLWHWYAPEYTSNPGKAKVDKRYDESLELGYDEVKEIILSYGFEFVHESWHTCKYSSDPLSMQATVYETVLFTCKKPDISFTSDGPSSG